MVSSRREIVILSVAVIFLYAALNTEFTWHFGERETFLTYDMLAEAFLSGQLHLKKEVDRERWESGDPLNPSLKRPFQFDAIIWDGKYYFMQPPLPGVLHAIWIALTGKACLTGLVVIASGLGNFLLIGSFLSRIRRRFFPETPMWILTYCWLSFGISGIQLYAIARPVIYHEAILLGNFFVLSGFLVLLVAWERKARSLWYPILSGALFGAAVACRLPLILYPIVFALCYAVFSLARNEPKAPRPVTIAAWTIPIIGFFSLLLGYNYLRFGSLLDFGDTHVIFPYYMHYIYLAKFNNFYRLAHIPLNLYCYLLALPEFNSSFPFQFFPSSWYWDANVHVVREVMGSIFIISPVLALCFLAPFGYRYGSERTMLSFILVTISVCSVAVFGSYLCYVWSAPRFAYDFVPLLFLVLYCGTAGVWARTASNRRFRLVFLILLCGLFIFNAVQGFCLGYQASSY
jgi:heme exporter protein D